MAEILQSRWIIREIHFFYTLDVGIRVNKISSCSSSSFYDSTWERSFIL